MWSTLAYRVYGIWFKYIANCLDEIVCMKEYITSDSTVLPVSIRQFDSRTYMYFEDFLRSLRNDKTCVYAVTGKDNNTQKRNNHVFSMPSISQPKLAQYSQRFAQWLRDVEVAESDSKSLKSLRCYPQLTKPLVVWRWVAPYPRFHDADSAGCIDS